MPEITRNREGGRIEEGATAASLEACSRAHLPHGITIGSHTFTTAILRPLTFGDIMDAQEAAEKVVATGKEITLVSSPALLGQETLRRQIARLESQTGAKYEGPLSIEDLRRLHPDDAAAIDAALTLLDMADAEKIARDTSSRGRDSASEARP